MEVPFPLLGWDLTGRGPLGKAEATQAHRAPPLQDPAQRPQCVSCALLAPPPHHSPGEEACCHGIYRHAAACSAWSPTGLSPGSHLEKKLKGNPKPREQGQQSLIPSTPRKPVPLTPVPSVSPLCTLHSNRTDICFLDWPFPCSVLPQGLKWGRRAERMQKWGPTDVGLNSGPCTL